MDGNKRNFFKKRSQTEFKRKGSSNKKGRWKSASHEESLRKSHAADTVYCILCPSRKTGSVIGKGGSIIKALREETQANITVSESVPGSDERVITIYSSPTKVSRDVNSDENSSAENEREQLEPHCAAQNALLKVHDRIVGDDLFGGMESDDGNQDDVVTARLLVPNNMVGCLLGRRGDVIQRLRSDTGANIRVLPPEHLPSCAMNTDELVLVSGKKEVAKRALYMVSTLLHQNPRKDQAPYRFAKPSGGASFTGGNPMKAHRDPASHNMPAIPWMEGHENRLSGFELDGFSGAPPGCDKDATAEFSMKILCSVGKIGGIIGKGGSNVKQLQLETGAGINVEDARAESDERVIRVSAFEALWNPRSRTIDAILQLQNRISEFSEKGTITTRLLVPSSKVGCILGQGGQVINEMRRRTQADIRVLSNDQKPKCATEDEELVQISGNFGVAKDALAEVASRLRVRILRVANAGALESSVGPIQGFEPARRVPSAVPSRPAAIGASSSSGYEPFRGAGGHLLEPRDYPLPPAATGFSHIKSAIEAKLPKKAAGSVMGTGGSTISSFSEVPGARTSFEDFPFGGSELEFRKSRVKLEDYHRSSMHPIAAQSYGKKFLDSGELNMNADHGYQNLNLEYSPYDKNSQHSLYRNMHPQQSPHYNNNSQQSPYQNMYSQRVPYQNVTQQSPLQVNAQPGGYYANTTARYSTHDGYSVQQASNPYVNSRKDSFLP